MKRITLSILALALWTAPQASRADNSAPALRCSDAVLADLEAGKTLSADSAGFLAGTGDAPNQVRLPDGSKYAGSDLGDNKSTSAGGNALCTEWVWFHLWRVKALSDAWANAAGLDADKTKAKAKVLRGIVVDFSAIDAKAAAVNAAAAGVYQAMVDLGVVDGGAIAHAPTALFAGVASVKVDAVSFKIAAKLPDTPAASDDPKSIQPRLDYITKTEGALKNLWTPGDAPVVVQPVPPPGKGKTAAHPDTKTTTAPAEDKPGAAVAAYYAALSALSTQLGGAAVTDQKTAAAAVDQIAKITAAPIENGWTQTALGTSKLDDYDLALRNQVYTNFYLITNRLKDAKDLVTNGGKVSIADMIKNMDAQADPLNQTVTLNGKLTKAASDLNSALYAPDSDFSKMANVFDANHAKPDWIKSPQGQQIMADLLASGAYTKDAKGQVVKAAGGGLQVVQSKTTPGTYDVLGADGKPLVSGLANLPANADDQSKLTSSVADKIISGQPHAAQLQAFLASIKPVGTPPVQPGPLVQPGTTGPAGVVAAGSTDPGAAVGTGVTGPAGAAGAGVTGPAGLPGQPGGSPVDLTAAMRAAGGPGAAGCDNPNRTQAGYAKDLNSADAQAAALSSSQRSDAFSGIMDQYKTTAQSCQDRYNAIADNDPHGAAWVASQRQGIDTECGTTKGSVIDGNPPTTGTLGTMRQQLLAQIAAQKQAGADAQNSTTRNTTQASNLYKAAVTNAVSGASPPLWQQVRADNFKMAKDWADYPGFDDALLTRFIQDDWTPGTPQGDANIAAAAGKVKVNPKTGVVDPGSLQSFVKPTLQSWPPIVAYHKAHPSSSSSSVPTGDLRNLRNQFNSPGGN